MLIFAKVVLLYGQTVAKVVATLLLGFITGINARNQRGLT